MIDESQLIYELEKTGVVSVKNGTVTILKDVVPSVNSKINQMRRLGS